MTLEQDIREHIGLYLMGALDLSEFEAWLVGATWNIQQSGDQEATDLTFRVESALAEMTGGYTTENDLRHGLTPLLQVHWASPFEILDHQVERLETRRACLRFGVHTTREEVLA